MDTNVLNKRIVLVVNSLYQKIHVTTPKKALISMNSSPDGEDMAAMGINFEFSQKDGEYNLEDLIEMRTLNWEEWIGLPVRTIDNAIHTSKLSIRVPTVILARNFDKMPTHKLRATKRNIFIRDGFRCQYSGKVLPMSKLSVDHVIPKSKGGKDSWENLVACEKEINSQKGDRFNHEVGLKLLRSPKSPPVVRAVDLIREARHFTWKYF